MTEIKIYTKKNCPYCVAAKNYLNNRQLAFEEIDVTDNNEARLKLVEMAEGRKTVPQIFINGNPIGGYDDMMLLVNNNNFDNLL